jgi:hypothetical protein
VGQQTVAHAALRQDVTFSKRSVIKVERLSDLVVLRAVEGKLHAQWVYPEEFPQSQYFETISPPGFWRCWSKRVNPTDSTVSFSLSEWVPPMMLPRATVEQLSRARAGRKGEGFEMRCESGRLYIYGPKGPTSDGPELRFSFGQNPTQAGLGCGLAEVTWQGVRLLSQAHAPTWDELLKKTEPPLREALGLVQMWIDRGSPYGGAQPRRAGSK